MSRNKIKSFSAIEKLTAIRWVEPDETMPAAIKKALDTRAVDALAAARASMTFDVWHGCLWFEAAMASPLLTEYAIRVREARVEGRSIDDLAAHVVWDSPESIGMPVSERAQMGHRIADFARHFNIIDALTFRRVVGTETVLYALRALHARKGNGYLAMTAPEWAILDVSHGEVENIVEYAHQCRWVHYQAAGTIVELSFPPTSSLVTEGHPLTTIRP